MGLIITYEWMPGSDACGRCMSRSVITTYRPSRPHPHCDCFIVPGPDVCEKDEEETRVTDGGHEEEVGVVPKGGSTQVSVTKTFTSTDKWHFGVDEGGVGSEESESESNTTTQTFNHSGETEESEVVLANYEGETVKKLEHYDCVFIDFWQTREYHDSKLTGFRQVPSSEWNR